MAAPNICATVGGPLEIWVDTGAANGMEFLGWTANGAQIEEIGFHSPIVSDQNGGDQGPPVDYQFFGLQHRVTLELTKFQSTVVAKVGARYNPNTSSASVGVGMLLGCVGAQFRLLLKSTTGNFIRNYLGAVVLDPVDYSPVGSQATRIRCAFTCNAVDGVMYNSSTTGT